MDVEARAIVRGDHRQQQRAHHVARENRRTGSRCGCAGRLRRAPCRAERRGFDRRLPTPCASARRNRGRAQQRRTTRCRHTGHATAPRRQRGFARRERMRGTPASRRLLAAASPSMRAEASRRQSVRVGAVICAPRQAIEIRQRLRVAPKKQQVAAKEPPERLVWPAPRAGARQRRQRRYSAAAGQRLREVDVRGDVAGSRGRAPLRTPARSLESPAAKATWPAA